MNFEELDEYYSRLARELPIRSQNEGKVREPDMLTIGHLDSEEAQLFDILTESIDWFRTRPAKKDESNPCGLKLYRRTHPLQTRADSMDPNALDAPPHLLLLVDSSSSMEFRPLYNEPERRGKFDVLLTACWGIFRFIEFRGLDGQVRINAINFSSTTRSSGWMRSANLDRVKRVVANYQCGGTTLSVAELKRAFETGPGRILVVAFTDGNISNAKQVLDVLRTELRERHRITLFHIGKENEFTEGVKDLGGQVHVLQGAGDLVGLCLETAESHYGPSADP